MRHLQKLRRFDLILILAAVGAVAVEGQSLSFLKTLPGASSGAAVIDASGIYIFGPYSINKYDQDGATLWSRGFPTGQVVAWVAATGAGVYAAGHTDGPQAFVRLYDVQGNEKWTRQLGFGSDYSLNTAVAADTSGVYVAGNVRPRGAAGFSYLRKYDDRGAELWTKNLDDGSAALAADPSGVYVRGSQSFRKYDAGGTEVWTRPITGQTIHMAANATGVYVTGYNSSKGYFLARYDSSGNEMWSRSGTAGWVALDTNSVYVARSTIREPGQCASGSEDAFVTRYDTDGNELWSRQFGTSGPEYPSIIAADSGGVFIAGSGFPGTFLAKLDKTSVPASPFETRIRNECVVNAASYVGGAVSPGEIVTIFGTALGPSQPVSATIVEGRPVGATIADTRVLFAGMAAPLLYVSSGQVTAIVPNAVASRSSVTIQVEHSGALSNGVTLPVLQAHLGTFTLDASGQGRAAVVNEDGTLNLPTNPARRGSIVAIFGTGGGQTDPALADGQVAGNPPPRLKIPVRASDPELECTGVMSDVQVLYAGSVASAVAGLVQVNVRVPDSASAGNWTLDLYVGDSPSSVQIAVGN